MNDLNVKSNIWNFAQFKLTLRLASFVKARRERKTR